MMGSPNWAPKLPGFVIVKVPPWTSSGFRPLARARVGEVRDRAAQAEQVLLVCVLQHGHDEPPVERHRNPDVDLLLVDDVVAVDETH